MFSKAIAVAMAASLMVSTAAMGGAAPPPRPPAAHPPNMGPGPWIVGGVFVSTLSLMFCSWYVGNTTHHDMTSEQAQGAALLPFSCLWWNPSQR